jgi:hypothetical protein
VKSLAGPGDEAVRTAFLDERGEFPSPSALCNFFDRASVCIWRELLRLLSELLNQSGHAVIDATYFDRRQAPSHYLNRCEQEAQAVQVTFLVDIAEGAIITHIAAQTIQTARRLRSPCGTQSTCRVSPPTKATMT